jgi:simple sugar transport system permease protein
MKRRWVPLAVTLGCLAVLILTLALAGQPPAEALAKMAQDSFATPAGWRDIVAESTPLILCGLAVFIGLQAGLFNIGADGQLTMGAFAAAAVALAMPSAVGGFLALVVGAAAGALWAFPAAWLRVKRGAHEVISTILLNYIAIALTSWFVTGPMQGPGQQGSTTARIEEAARLPILIQEGPFRLGPGLIIAIALAAAYAFWSRRTTAAYELRLTGVAPQAAEAAGVQAGRVKMAAMAVSGAFAGLAGALLLVGQEYRFYQGFSAGYGFDGLGVALVAGGAAWAIAPAGVLFGMIAEGSSALGLQGVPRSISVILLGLLLITAGVWRKKA